MTPAPQGIARFLPGDHSTVQVPDVRVAKLDQRARCDGAHASTATVHDELCAFIRRQFSQAGLDLVEGYKKIGPVDLAIVRDMNIDQGPFSPA